ncbi:heme oxygenase-like protein [Herbihabitans rhizosphaerae]|uniref:Heme oxygenase-like protein n=1 Tax=Herbihabitans rhizosphaerae TaxID=1872711 RepID=A0A4Q7KFS6_9PSEU|nr:iron-containing redox enzyme family protein [Herbihabitans rhizosphaerae]RZS30531.1 heme oxygenase-like protein [Herbihabitans rhizosphaerae]
MSTTAEPILDDRTRYLRALDPESPPSAADVAAALADAADEPADIDDLIAEVRSWCTDETARFAEVLRDGGDPTVRYTLLNCSPLALSAGAWLQWMSSAGNAETEPALHVLSLYASDIGVGHAFADRGSVFREVLRRHRIGDHETDLQLTGHERIEGFSFRFPGLLLAMSRLPDRFSGELLGADLCLRAVGLPPPLAAIELGEDVRRDLDLGAAREGDPRPALDRARDAVRAFDETTVRTGFHWAAGELRRWCASLLREAGLSTSPDYDMWRLIYARARQAAVYHARYKLDGRPLAEWFANVDSGPSQFLAALANSPLVRPGEPDRSPLLRGLIGPKGPMFRIFTDDELAVIRRWISALPRADGEAEPLREAQRSWHRHGDRPVAGHAPAPATGQQPANLRAAYTALLSRDGSEPLRRFARGYVARWLARSRYRLDHAHQLPREWDRDSGLRTWLEQEHDRHGREFDESDTPLPTRDELIDSTLQLAPLIMIDGGWLQGFTDYRLASSAAGHFLFQTYWDELGNGEMDINHPRIYRNLLRDMGIDLPPTVSPSFAEYAGFRAESFALPVYWLSISRFPQTFMPEILGLNLAMELSGVGGGYRSARIALKHYGFSTQFVDLHNTIDNVATGHSAWAVDAIDSHLAGLGGSDQRCDIWERIRVGYRSLRPPTGAAARTYAALRTRVPRSRRS